MRKTLARLVRAIGVRPTRRAPTARPALEPFEDRLVPSHSGGGGAAMQVIAVGAGEGGAPQVRVLDADTGQDVRSFLAYGPHFTGGVRVAVGDLNGDGVPDIVTAPGPGRAPQVRIFDGATGALTDQFLAYDDRFQDGVYVAVGDVNGDGTPDIVTGADAGGGPHVEVFSGKDLSPIWSFMAYDPRFPGGVRVAAGDINGDGHADVITGAGPGGGPHVKVFSGKDQRLLQSFMAYDADFNGGVYVAEGLAARENGKHHDHPPGQGEPITGDVITGAGLGGRPEVRVFSGETMDYGVTGGKLLDSFLAYAGNFPGGVRVGFADDHIVTGAGPGGGPHVRTFDTDHGDHGGKDLSQNAFDADFTGGVFVGGG